MGQNRKYIPVYRLDIAGRDVLREIYVANDLHQKWPFFVIRLNSDTFVLPYDPKYSPLAVFLIYSRFTTGFEMSMIQYLIVIFINGNINWCCK